MSDWIIGGHKPRISRRARSWLIGAGLVLALLGLLAAIYHQVSSYAVPGDAPELAAPIWQETPAGEHFTAGTGRLSFRSGIAVLEVSGTRAEVGAAAGALSPGNPSAGINSLYEEMRTAFPDRGFFSSFIPRFHINWSLRRLADGIPSATQEELGGLYRALDRSGAATSFEEVVRAHAAFDLGAPAPGSPGRDLQAISRSLSFVVAPKKAGDPFLIGRSFSLPGTPDAGLAAAQEPILLVTRGDGEIPFASLTWPGFAGVVSGINASRIALFLHPSRTTDVKPQRAGQPIALLARDILARAASLEQAVAMLQSARVLGAGTFLVVDGNDNTWASVEKSPTRIFVLSDPPPPVVTDTMTTKVFADDPFVDRIRRAGTTLARAARVVELIRSKPPADAAAAVAVLRDRHRLGGGPLPPGHHGAVSEALAVHSAVFDAAGLVLWIGGGPGADGPFRAFDLGPLFFGDAFERAPLGVAPASKDDVVLGAALLAAERDLLPARLALAAGDLDRTRAAAARALARVATYPSALRLAGEAARAAGDSDKARFYYQRYLELIPDDAAFAEHAEAYLAH